MLAAAACASVPVKLDRSLYIEAVSSGDAPLGFAVTIEREGKVSFQAGGRTYSARLSEQDIRRLTSSLEAIGTTLPRGELESAGPHDASIRISIGEATATYVQGALPVEIRALAGSLRVILEKLLPLRPRHTLVALDDLLAGESLGSRPSGLDRAMAPSRASSRRVGKTRVEGGDVVERGVEGADGGGLGAAACNLSSSNQ